MWFCYERQPGLRCVESEVGGMAEGVAAPIPAMLATTDIKADTAAADDEGLDIAGASDLIRRAMQGFCVEPQSTTAGAANDAGLAREVQLLPATYSVGGTAPCSSAFGCILHAEDVAEAAAPMPEESDGTGDDVAGVPRRPLANRAPKVDSKAQQSAPVREGGDVQRCSAPAADGTSDEVDERRFPRADRVRGHDVQAVPNCLLSDTEAPVPMESSIAV